MDVAIIAAIIGAIISIFGFALIAYIQNRVTRKNQFETTFFNLLASIRTLVNSIKGDVNITSKAQQRLANSKGGYDASSVGFLLDDEHFDKTPSGMKFFELATDVLLKYIDDYMAESVFELSAIKDEEERKQFLKHKIADAYNDFFDNHAPLLGHYFRYVYNVIKFVDGSDIIDSSQKRIYVNFIQAQMSADELTLLFYNGVGRYGKNFYLLMQPNKYFDFLQNVHGDRIYEANILMQVLYPGHRFRHLDSE